MSRISLVAILLTVVTTAAAAQGTGVMLTVTPNRAPIGQPVRITLDNRTTATVIMPNPAPWGIHTPAGAVVFAPSASPATTTLAPGKSLSWIWDQKDQASGQVVAGYYEARLFFVFNPGYPFPSIRAPFSVGRTATLTASGQPAPDATIGLFLHAPDFGGRGYQVALSLGKAPGIPIGGGRILQLNPDPLFLGSITAGPPVFGNFSGQLDGNGRATAKLWIPKIPQLRGFHFFAAAVILHLAAPNGIAEATPATLLTVQ